MTETSLEEQLTALFSELFGQSSSRIGPDDDLEQVLGLDSLARLRLLAAVEKRFGIRFPDDQLGGLRTLAHLLGLIQNQ